MLLLVLMFGLIVFLWLIAAVDGVMYRRDKAREAAAHPGQRWTPAGWVPVEDQPVHVRVIDYCSGYPQVPEP